MNMEWVLNEYSKTIRFNIREEKENPSASRSSSEGI
jgi:hypothetical protein